MRTWYETMADVQNERDIIDAYCGLVAPIRGARLYAHKSKRGCPYDFALTRGGQTVVAFAEAKRRHCSIGKYDTIMLSLGKWSELVKLNESTRRPVVFVVRFDDALGSVLIRPSQHEDLRWGGRTRNTRDAADIEPVIHIPTDSFKVWCQR